MEGTRVYRDASLVDRRRDANTVYHSKRIRIPSPILPAPHVNNVNIDQTR